MHVLVFLTRVQGQIRKYIFNVQDAKKLSFLCTARIHENDGIHASFS